MKNIFKLMLGVIMVTSCNGFGLQKDYKYESKPLDPHIDMTTWEFINEGYLKDSLTIFKEAIVYAGLEEMYQQTGNVYTYLLINNFGMNKFIVAKGVTDIHHIEKEQVARMLQYHTIIGEYHAYNKKLPVEPIYVKTKLEDMEHQDWGMMTIKVNKSSQNSIGQYPNISNGNIVINETGSNFKAKRISSVTSNIMPKNGFIHIFNDYSRFSTGNTSYVSAY